MMKKSIYTLLYLLMAMISFASCQHKELCYKHPHTTRVRIDVDWSKFIKYETPTGMTLMLYPQYTGEPAISNLSNNTSHAIVNLAPNKYHVLVFNQSESEFGSITFRGLDKQETAQVVTNETKSNWYKVKGQSEKVATEPEWLGVGNYSYAEVTQQMIDADVAATMGATTRSGEAVIATITPVNIIYTVNVKVHIKGIYNLRSARGSLNGMAEGYNLTEMKPLAGKVTHLMEAWTIKRDQTDPTAGIIEGSFTSFGLPSGHQSTAEENLLTISMLLIDNKTVMTFTFNVGNNFTRKVIEGNAGQEAEVQLELFLELNTNITLPDVKPEGGSTGGFDATVDDWGEEEEHGIDI